MAKIRDAELSEKEKKEAKRLRRTTTGGGVVAKKSVVGIFAEQVDSVLRMWTAGEISDKAMEKYLMQFSSEGLAHVFMGVYRIFTKDATKAVTTSLRGFDPTKLPKSVRMVGRDTVYKEAVELDGLANKLLNKQIEPTEFMASAAKVSKYALAMMLMVIILGWRDTSSGGY